MNISGGVRSFAFGTKILRPLSLAVGLFSASCAPYQLVGFAEINPQHCRGGSVGRKGTIEINFDREKLKAARAIELTFLINYKSDTNYRSASYLIMLPQLDKAIKGSVKQIGESARKVELSRIDISKLLQQEGGPTLTVRGTIDDPGDWCLTIDLQHTIR